MGIRIAGGHPKIASHFGIARCEVRACAQDRDVRREAGVRRTLPGVRNRAQSVVIVQRVTCRQLLIFRRRGVVDGDTARRSVIDVRHRRGHGGCHRLRRTMGVGIAGRNAQKTPDLGIARREGRPRPDHRHVRRETGIGRAFPGVRDRTQAIVIIQRVARRQLLIFGGRRVVDRHTTCRIVIDIQHRGRHRR